MASIPYTIRRNGAYYFQIRIPEKLQEHLGKARVRIKLDTAKAEEAKRKAAELQSHYLNQFRELRQTLSVLDAQELVSISEPEITQLCALRFYEMLHDDEQDRQDGVSFGDAQEAIVEELETLSEGLPIGKIPRRCAVRLGEFLHRKGLSIQESTPGYSQLAYRYLQTEIRAIQLLLARERGELVETPPKPVEAPKLGPTLGAVIAHFLDNYQADKKGSMYAKHQAVLGTLNEVLGADTPVSNIKQVDLNRYFSLIQKLPPRWKDEARQRGLSLVALADENSSEGMSPKTFEDSYKASVRSFLKVAKNTWQDQGFPTNLNLDGIEYRGDREEGEAKQRAFTLAELKRLFEGAEYQALANYAGSEHCYWLPLLGLFTGARINEICQINPQTDIKEEDGINYLWLTDETPGDERITKSIKNKSSQRKVPIHAKLIELGFLKFSAKLKNQGSKLIFPAWSPESGRASRKAEDWFKQFLRDTGLRDETPGARIAGFHAFRSTLLNLAMNSGIDLTPITGHAGEQSAIVRGYQGELALQRKKQALNGISIDVSFPVRS